MPDTSIISLAPITATANPFKDVVPFRENTPYRDFFHPLPIDGIYKYPKGDDEKFILGETDFKVIHIPGHTLGHIAVYSEKAGVIFTGDTLFSLGCGRIFEGTLEQMFNSLEKIKNLSKNTMIYCGHEYTNNNAKFCKTIDKNNKKLQNKIKDIEYKTEKKLPTLPVMLSDELETNIFLRCDDIRIKNNLKMNNSSKLEVFTKLRKLKDQF